MFCVINSICTSYVDFHEVTLPSSNLFANNLLERTYLLLIYSDFLDSGQFSSIASLGLSWTAFYLLRALKRRIHE